MYFVHFFLNKKIYIKCLLGSVTWISSPPPASITSPPQRPTHQHFTKELFFLLKAVSEVFKIYFCRKKCNKSLQSSSIFKTPVYIRLLFQRKNALYNLRCGHCTALPSTSSCYNPKGWGGGTLCLLQAFQIWETQDFLCAPV